MTSRRKRDIISQAGGEVAARIILGPFHSGWYFARLVSVASDVHTSERLECVDARDSNKRYDPQDQQHKHMVVAVGFDDQGWQPLLKQLAGKHIYLVQTVTHADLEL